MEAVGVDQSDVFASVKIRARVKLERDLGPEFMRAFNDAKTVEMLLNADGTVWQERLGESMRPVTTLRKAQAEAAIKTVAGYLDKEITAEQPYVEGEFPLDGSRFSGMLPPIVESPTFSIRKKAISIYKLADYVRTGVMTELHAQVLRDACANRKNIVIAGGTSTGKTTLANACIAEVVDIHPDDRFWIIEDTGELQCAAKNRVITHTTLSVSMTTLLRLGLRYRPDRILVGEVRGAEALDLLDAWNTGHEGGVATLHANSASSALTRLKSLVGRNEFAPKEIEALIGEAVHLVVHITRTPTGRRISEIIEISGYSEDRYLTRSL